MRLPIHFASSLVLLTACSETALMAPPAEVSADLSPAPMSRKADISAAPLVLAESAIAKPRPGRLRTPRQGVVTAGDIDDTLNLAAFLRYQKRMARQTGLPTINAVQPVDFRVHSDGLGLPGVPVSLLKPGAAEPFYTGTTGVDGRLTVFPALLGTGRINTVELRTFDQSGDPRTTTLKSDGQRHNIFARGTPGYDPEFLDLVFVFDTTGSMGDELAWLTKEFGAIVRSAQKAAPKANLRFGLVAYRDKGDAYVVRNFGFTRRQAEMQRWLRSLDASGGGDYPEAADEALMAAADLPWRRGHGERLMFHVADAPAHKSNAKRYLLAAQKAAQKNVQIFGLGASGVADEAEFLMRQAAVATQGRYMFLTDDSGVGNAHAEPNVACYNVTRLKSLLTRVITSELTGIRQEPKPNEVIRSVGNYRRGVCVQ